MELPRSRQVTSLMDDHHCLRGRRRDLEVSPCFDVASQLNDPSIAFDRSRPASEVRPVGWLVDRSGRSVRVRERNYHFPTVINLCALVHEITVVCARNVLISMLMARFDVRNNVSFLTRACKLMEHQSSKTSVVYVINLPDTEYF